MRALFIDNFDSFSYNLTYELQMAGCEVEVYRNDADPAFIRDKLAELSSMGQTALVLSPGPGTPEQSGHLLEFIEQNLGQYPVLGICLGHQAIGQVMGGKVVRAPEICHGKASLLKHDHGPLFTGIPDPFQAARYHSLVVTDVPDTLTIGATYKDLCMAFYSTKLKAAGLQFHPESILTTQGRRILRNCLRFMGAQL